MRFNNQHLDVDGYEADRRMHAEKDDRLWDKSEAPERIYLNKNEIGQYLLWMDKESDEDIEYIRADIHKDTLKSIDLMIKDRDAFNDKNVELEKKLKITVEMLEIAKGAIHGAAISNPNQDSNKLYKILDSIYTTLNQLKGDQNDSRN